MAVDPATLKAVAKAAVSVVTNKEARSNLLYIILIAAAVGLAVILMPIYILTHPFEMLKSAFADSPDDAAYIEQYKTENDDKMLVIGEGLIVEGTYPLPVIGGTVINEYGESPDPVTGADAFHYGTDFAGEWRSEIFSIADGVVKEVCTEKNNGYGNYLIVEHTGQRTAEDGAVTTETFYALYGHLNEIYMFEGQSLKKGAVIGLMGGDPEKDSNPGKSTGTHLHFEIRETQSGSGIDPSGYIFPEPTPEENTESEAKPSE